MLTPVEKALWILIDRLALEDIKELIESANILREGSRLGSLAATNAGVQGYGFLHHAICKAVHNKGAATGIAVYLINHMNLEAVSKKDRRNRTALWHAAEQGLNTVVEQLLARDISLAGPDEDNRTALSIASEKNHLNVIKTLLNAIPQPEKYVNLMDKNGNMPLHYACIHEDAAATNLLLDSKADPFAPNNKGTTPVQVAINRKRITVVRELAGYGALIGINIQNYDLNYTDLSQHLLLGAHLNGRGLRHYEKVFPKAIKQLNQLDKNIFIALGSLPQQENIYKQCQRALATEKMDPADEVELRQWLDRRKAVKSLTQLLLNKLQQPYYMRQVARSKNFDLIKCLPAELVKLLPTNSDQGKTNSQIDDTLEITELRIQQLDIINQVTQQLTKFKTLLVAHKNDRTVSWKVMMTALVLVWLLFALIFFLGIKGFTSLGHGSEDTDSGLMRNVLGTLFGILGILGLGVLIIAESVHPGSVFSHIPYLEISGTIKDCPITKLPPSQMSIYNNLLAWLQAEIAKDTTVSHDLDLCRAGLRARNIGGFITAIGKLINYINNIDKQRISDETSKGQVTHLYNYPDSFFAPTRLVSVEHNNYSDEINQEGDEEQGLLLQQIT